MIKTLFIDLDDTVYPPNNGIWELLGERIVVYMRDVLGIPPDEIIEIREHFLEKYGSTINGLRAEYGADLHDYLEYVHDEDLSPFIQKDQELRLALESLPQPKWIFTNASKSHAEQVLGLLGIRDLFQGIIDLEDTDPYCKPHKGAFEKAFALANHPKAEESLFVDDRVSNLDSARALGMYTLLVSARHVEGCDHPQIKKLSALPEFLTKLESTIKI